MKVNLSPRFTRAYQKLPRHIQEDFKEKIQTFIKELAPSDAENAQTPWQTSAVFSVSAHQWIPGSF